MPNGVKYSTTTPSGAFSKSNVAIGVSGSLGPTANTGFYSMPAPQSGKYIISKVAASGVPLFFAPQNDAELIKFAKQEGATGANTGSASAVLAWISTQPNLLATNTEYPSNFPNIVVDGLVYYVDAGLTTSYPGSGTSWNDTSGNGLTNDLQNGTSYNSNNGGYMNFDGVDDKVQGPDSSLVDFTPTDNFSLETFCYAAATNNMIPIVERYWWATEGKGGFGIRLTNYGGQTPPVFFITGVVPGVGQSDYGVSAPTVWSPNTWYHIVGTKNSSGVMKIYINGSLANTNNTNNIIPLTSIGYPLMIGARGDTRDQYAVSRIPIVRIYRKELSAAEVLQNFNAQKSRFGL